MPLHDDPHAAPPADDAMLPDEIAMLEESLGLLGDVSDRVVEWFYAGLFVEAPQLRALFPAAMDAQRDRLFRALTGAIGNLGDPDRLVPMLHQLGSDHRKYGVKAEHYELVGRALVGAVRRHLEGIWVPELEDAWVRAYDVMARTMQEGARESAAVQPAWWRGEIVAHERRADDLAVIVVRTDRPYEYEAGQYASIETPYRPRSWRSYSMATAPSPDGLLEFHVRSVGAGWVSGPLVWRATVGDVLRLGAPQGGMRIDKQSRRDVLCVAGGTGLAPIKALIDDMAKWNGSRAVTLFFGVRRSAELYDMATLHRLAAVNRWLRVVPVVSEEPTFAGEKGLLPDAVARHGTWTDHDVVVCGSPEMTRVTHDRLVGMGVPEGRITYDVVGDTHPATAQVIDLRGHQRGSVRRRASRSAGRMGRPNR
jgi:NAD(P)H-flavin reductase/hemoglobin-like flavoprotein